MEVMFAIVGSTASILAAIVSLAYWLGRKFTVIDSRFGVLENRLDGLERRLDVIGRTLVHYVQSTHHTLIDFLTLKGLLAREEKEFLAREIERIGSAHLEHLNPLKSEEAKFIVEVAREVRTGDPREIDLRKLDKVMEIAQRWMEEEPSYEAAKLATIAYMLKAILKKERGEL